MATRDAGSSTRQGAGPVGEKQAMVNGKETPFVRNPYNYDRNAAGDESGLQTGSEGGAKQSFKDEVDINTIVKRFGIGYEMPQNPKIPTYGDYTNIPDFHTAMNLVAETRENFELLPAHVRAKFENDEEKFVNFCLNSENRKELGEMGLLSPEAIQRDLEAARASQIDREGTISDTPPIVAKTKIPPTGGSQRGNPPAESE